MEKNVDGMFIPKFNQPFDNQQPHIQRQRIYKGNRASRRRDLPAVHVESRNDIGIFFIGYGQHGRWKRGHAAVPTDAMAHAIVAAKNLVIRTPETGTTTNCAADYTLNGQLLQHLQTFNYECNHRYI